MHINIGLGENQGKNFKTSKFGYLSTGKNSENKGYSSEL